MSRVRAVLATRQYLVETIGRDIINRQAVTFKEETCLFYVRTQYVPRSKHSVVGFFVVCVWTPTLFTSDIRKNLLMLYKAKTCTHFEHHVEF
jgi:hypothetical protein